MSLRLLSPEEKSRLLASFAESFGFDREALGACDVLEGEEGLWAVSPTVIGLPLRSMRTDSIGILIAREGNGGLIPTIAALQLFARPREDSIRLTQGDAAAFIDRTPIPVDEKDGRQVVFFGCLAIDLGRVREGRLLRVQSKPRG
jgi:hypothetical protein